ncbi:MAG: hypothetical protein GEU99_22060 [Luteitalea sp.]|nr:hypothetical protein [Luteitalea sp.]
MTFQETAAIWVTLSLVVTVPVVDRQEPERTPASASEKRFDAAPFGFPIDDLGGRANGVRWAEPRKVRQVTVECAGEGPVPPGDGVRLQYWHRSWDGQAEPILSEAGAGSVGWHGMDDWTNGEWKDAETSLRTEGRRWTFTLKPTGRKEFPKLRGQGVAYRKTLQIRLLTESPLPRLEAFRVYTDSVLRPLPVRILFGNPANPRLETIGSETVRVELFNGALMTARAAGSMKTSAGSSSQWILPANEEGSLQLDILATVDPSGALYDRTIVTVRSDQRPFSFAADDVARGERILVDDLGVLVVRGDDPIGLAAYRKARKEFSGKTVYDRVFAEPEQTLSRAWRDMPLKHPLYFVHGLPGNRNLMRQEPNGAIVVAGKSRWFKSFPSSRDAARKQWESEHHGYSFGFPPEDRRGGRELAEGYLPLLRTHWQDGPIFYEQSTVMDKLGSDWIVVRLDDPTVLLMRVRVANTSASQAGTARLFLGAQPAGTETLYADGNRILADYQGQPRLRYLIDTRQRGLLTNENHGVRWSLTLEPGASHDLYFLIPSITLDTEDEIRQLQQRDFERSSQRLGNYWKALTSRGMHITTPEEWLNDFAKAHLRHLLVNSYKELDSDYLHAHVGSFDYGVYPNESVMMISDLDRRGYHDEARRHLDAFLHYQGTVSFLGNYKSRKGLFYGAGGHETGNYNKSHGYVMWAMAEHWRMTRDREWMKRAAPKLVKACEWIIRERQATMKSNPDGSRPIEYGALPAGSLEDVTDFWYWLATNSATVWGFDALADALADFGHPEASRLQAEAKAYRDDVMRGITESRIRAPVVRLRDGTYVPKYPSRLYERGRSHGWLRETLEGPLFLLYYRLVPPEAPDAEWILKDYEDNLYISDEYGYSIPTFDRFWFSRGGFSMQANLLDGPPPYLYRDEIEHYVRAYFNAFASAFYPELRMCNEHSLPELGYPQGDHFKTSDEAQSMFWLRLMFVREDGEDLYLGQAIPRYWLRRSREIGIERAASHFGPLSLRMIADPENDRIKAVLRPPTRNPARKVYLRFRHPQAKPMRRVTVNGQDYRQFDVSKEWVVLPGDLQGVQEVVVTYAADKSSADQ